MNREIKFRAWRGMDMIYQEDESSASAAHFFNCVHGQHHVMQFTGIKDKSGNDIFEGDILREYKGSIGSVIFINGSFKCKMTHAESPWQIYYTKRKITFEIIGNIFENPELIKT